MSEKRAEILAEIESLTSLPELRPDDITVQELAERWGVSDRTVMSRMARLVRDGQFESLIVYDPSICRIRRVYRKLE